MIKVENIYYMLAYAYRNMRENGVEVFNSESFDNVADLMGAILSRGLSSQIKRGVHKDYINKSDVLRSPKGKIDVSSTISKQLMLNKQVLCNFDEYSEDILVNQILKSSAYVLCKSDQVRVEHKKALKRSLMYFENVSHINLKHIPWKDLKYDKNNNSYRFLLNICYLVAEGMLMSENGNAMKLQSFIDDQQMSRLYEKFLQEYFKKHYPVFNVSASFIDWQTDDGIIDFLPLMKSDVTIKYSDLTMIIDAKYYGKTMQSNQFSDRRTVHSNNLYQIFTYVKNKDQNSTGNVKGMLLYAKTDEEIIPNEKYEMSGNTIYVRTLDLGCDFSRIVEQLDEIAEIIKKTRTD